MGRELLVGETTSKAATLHEWSGKRYRYRTYTISEVMENSYKIQTKNKVIKDDYLKPLQQGYTGKHVCMPTI